MFVIAIPPCVYRVGIQYGDFIWGDVDAFVVVIRFTFDENSWHVRVRGATPEAKTLQGVIPHTDKNIEALCRHMTNAMQHSPIATEEPRCLDAIDDKCFFVR